MRGHVLYFVSVPMEITTVIKCYFSIFYIGFVTYIPVVILSFPVLTSVHGRIFYFELICGIVIASNYKITGFNKDLGLQHLYSSERTGIFVSSDTVILVTSS